MNHRGKSSSKGMRISFSEKAVRGSRKSKFEPSSKYWDLKWNSSKGEWKVRSLWALNLKFKTGNRPCQLRQDFPYMRESYSSWQDQMTWGSAR